MQLQTEYKAIVGLIARSLQLTPKEVRLMHLRSLSTAGKPPAPTEGKAEKSTKDGSKNEDDSSKEKQKQAVAAESSEKSSKASQDEGSSSPNPSPSSSTGEPGEDPNKNSNENDEKMRSVLTKAVLWLFTIYMFVAFFSLLITPRSERPEVNMIFIVVVNNLILSTNQGSTRYVSWNEFVHHMLAVGEVKELIIRPDMEMVTIILHEGAVIKGRKVSSTIFHMAVADANKFEEKLREVEKRLGIKDGVPVTYDRQTDTTGRILMLLLVCALLVSIATRMKSIKSPLSMDSFVGSAP